MELNISKNYTEVTLTGYGKNALQPTVHKVSTFTSELGRIHKSGYHNAKELLVHERCRGVYLLLRRYLAYTCILLP